MRKFLIVLFNIVFVASIVCSVVFGVLWGKANKQLNEDTQVAVINELKTENSALENELDEVYNENAFYKLENDSLKNENTQLKEQNTSLQENNSVLVEQNGVLSSNNNNLTSQIEDLLSQKAELESQNSNLSTQINELESLLDRYESLLPFIIEEDEAVVKYVVNGETKEVQVVQKGSKITDPYEITFNENEFHVFNYYELDGVPVDFSNYIVEDDITLVANITYRCKVSYYYEGSAPTYKGEFIVEDYIEIGGTFDLSVLKDGYNYAFALITEDKPLFISLDYVVEENIEIIVKEWKIGEREPAWSFDGYRE